MNRGSSTRLTGAPRTSVTTSLLLRRDGGGGPFAHDASGLADREHDVVVARAAADVALDGVPDLVVGRVVVAGQQVRGRHDHPRRAEPALQAVLLPERVLERVELALRAGHALDRRDARPVGLDREHRAALHGVAVDVDRAGPALAGLAADVRAGQAQVVPDHLDEEPAWLDVPLPRLAVHLERDVHLGHRYDLPPGVPATVRGRSPAVWRGGFRSGGRRLVPGERGTSMVAGS